MTLQAALIYLFLPHDLRFLGGLSFGLVICSALAARERLGKFFSSWALAAALCLTLLPWLGGQIYYARQFFPVAMGIQSKAEFYQRYVAFYSDYENLDRILPRESVLITNFRTSAVYSPRPIYFAVADLPADKEVFYFGCAFKKQLESLRKFKVEESVYENPNAVAEVFRTPGRRPVRWPLCVGRLLKNE